MFVRSLHRSKRPVDIHGRTPATASRTRREGREDVVSQGSPTIPQATQDINRDRPHTYQRVSEGVLEANCAHDEAKERKGHCPRCEAVCERHGFQLGQVEIGVLLCFLYLSHSRR